MKALILAAGQGSRIRSVHGDRPKCLIPINANRWTILDQQIHNLAGCGIEKIGIVVGYEKEQIIRHLKSEYPSSLSQFTIIENARYAETNNIYSLWSARDWVKGSSFVCLNADVAFDARILPDALSTALSARITMIVDRAWRDETMKVVIAESGITRMSKAISKDEFSATYIGISIFARRIVPRFLDKINSLIREGRNDMFFNAGVQQLIEEGVQVAYSETCGLPWAEIDDPGDLAFARLHVFPALTRAGVAA